MSDHFAGPSAEPSGVERSPRSVPRFSLIASAEIIDPENEIHLVGRISEISRKGCFVDLLNTLPTQTPIRIRISRDKGDFECSGTVLYEMDRMGMGVGFVDTPPEQLETLDSWIAEFPA